MALVLRHPFHDDTLTRRELRGHHSFKCDICSLEVRDAAYDCSWCSYVLHEACALVEIPLQIEKHHIHPEHPLVFESGKYKCDLCDISHDASVVIAAGTPLEEEGTIQHDSHDHPLFAFHVKMPNWISCGACREPIPGLAYGCQTCDYFLHESCARLPRQMLQHHFHPQHALTLHSEREGSGELWCSVCYCIKTAPCMAYYCEECDFRIDVGCATLLLSLQEQENEGHVAVDHPSHEHQLLSGQVKENNRTKFSCAVCDLKLSGEVYYCLGCIFFMHKLCADELPHEMVHYLHPEHHLLLLPKPYSEKGFDCSCCQVSSSDMAFHCASCQFDLHPQCALQTSCAARDGITAKIQYFAHDHPLVLGFSRIASCTACQLEISGLAYSCDDCKYYLHKSCAELPLQLENPLDSHPLNLVPERNACNICGSRSRAFTFNCRECAFHLCFKCATETPTLKHQLHEHALSYFGSYSNRDTVLCNSCGKADRNDFYSCRRCNFNLHCSCTSLPLTIQHDYHPYHPLVLFDRFVDGLPEYQYCDYCEKIRNPDHGVYRCAECWYSVHIGCVLPQATQHEKLYLDRLTNEIASLGETIEGKKKDLVALEEKREELEQERRKILANYEEQV